MSSAGGGGADAVQSCPTKCGVTDGRFDGNFSDEQKLRLEIQTVAGSAKSAAD